MSRSTGRSKRSAWPDLSTRGEIRIVANVRGPSADRDHTLRAYLPHGYSSATRYPVLYLFDGQNLFDRGEPAITPTWGVDTVMDRLVADGDVGPWIVIGIDHAGDARLAEYALWNVPRAGVLANGERFARFVEHDLAAWTDADLRYVLDADGRHHESDWHRRLPHALRWLLR